MNYKFKSFFLSLFTIVFLTSCSNFVESLQKNKPTGVEQQPPQNEQPQSQQPQVQPEVLYNITFDDFEYGEISSSKTTGIKAGEEIILSVEAEKGYVFKSLTVYNVQNKDVAIAQIVAGSSFKFTMPNSDVTVKVVFEAKPQEQTQQTTPDEQTQQPDNNEQSQQTGTEQQNQQTTPDDTSTQQTTPDDTTTQPPVPTGPVRYRVEHYQQDVDGSDTYELYAIQEKRGEAGSDTAASAKNYPGFTAVDFEQPKIAADGSTIVRIYYNRNTITYTFDPNGGNWDGSTDVVEVSGLFGAEVSIPQSPTRLGYVFNTWENNYATFNSPNQTVNALWIANTDTPYTLNIYSQKVEGDYSLESYVLYGTTDTTTSYEAGSRVGFDVVIQQTNIEPDGSGVLNVYWNRKSYTVSFDTNGGNPMENQQKLYMARISSIPVKDDWTFVNWYADSNFEHVFDLNNGIVEDITLHAYWVTDNVFYKFHEIVERLPAGTDGTFETDGEYVLFGDYPQSLLSDNRITVNENKSVKMGNMTVYGGNDGNLYYKYKNYDYTNYYKVEPIKWRVISRDENNMVVLLAEKILENMFFLEDPDYLFCTYGGSNVCGFLCEEFLYTAFTTSASNLIAYSQIDSLMTIIENDIILMEDSETNENKIYLLKYEDMLNNTIFPYNRNRIRTNTDFASRIRMNKDNKWWLRLPVYYTFGDEFAIVYGVDTNGRCSAFSEEDFMGVVPALSIFLPPAE